MNILSEKEFTALLQGVVEKSGGFVEICKTSKTEKVFYNNLYRFYQTLNTLSEQGDAQSKINQLYQRMLIEEDNHRFYSGRAEGLDTHVEAVKLIKEMAEK